MRKLYINHFLTKKLSKEGQELKKIYNRYPDKRKEFMKMTETSYHETFVNVLGKEKFTSEQMLS